LAALRAGSVSLGVKLVDHEDRLELCSSNDFRAASISALSCHHASSLSCFAEKTAKGQTNIGKTCGSLPDLCFDHRSAGFGIGE
jgi:hypothetical protein